MYTYAAKSKIGTEVMNYPFPTHSEADDDVVAAYEYARNTIHHRPSISPSPRKAM